MMRSLLIDFYRMISSRQFWLGVFGIGLLLVFGGYQAGQITDIYVSYLYNGMFSTFILTYAFCAISFSSCFVEDEENQYWLQAIKKVGLKNYVWSKTIICFLSGIVTMVLGVLVFAFVLRFKMPFYIEHSFLEWERPADTFGFLIYSETILLYFICSAAINGMLGGIFSVFAALLSLYEKNRLFTICVPVVGFYFLENLLTNTLQLPSAFNIWYIYSAGHSLFGNTVKNVIYALVVASICVIIAEYFIEKKMRREVFGEEKLKGDC